MVPGNTYLFSIQENVLSKTAVQNHVYFTGSICYLICYDIYTVYKTQYIRQNSVSGLLETRNCYSTTHVASIFICLGI